MASSPDAPRDVDVRVATGALDPFDRILEATDEVSAAFGGQLVLLDPDAVYSRRHIDSAVLHARRAFERGKQSAHLLAGEVLLYVSGERQVRDAIERAGLREGLERFVVVSLGPRAAEASDDFLRRVGWVPDPAGLPATNPGALARYGVSPEGGDPELTILQRVALLDLRK